MKISIKIASLVLCTSLLYACSSNNSKPVNEPNETVTTDTIETNTALLLTPGSSAGRISLGKNAEEVYKDLGKADAGDAAMQKSVAIWYKNHDPKSYAIAIYTVRDTGNNPAALIRQIRVTSPEYKTADSVGVSSTLDQIRKKYRITKLTDITDNGNVLEMYDSLRGIAFETDKNGVCRAIVIHKADEALSTTSLPLR